MNRLRFQPVSREEREEFLGVFARYWAELETYQDVPEPFLREDYAAFIESAPATTRFEWLFDGATRVGFAVFRPSAHWYRPGVVEGYVEELFIEPAQRGKGYGVEAAKLIVAALGTGDIRLHVLPRNKPAQALWKKAGFQLEILQLRRSS